MEESFTILPDNHLDVSRDGIKPKYLAEIASSYWDQHATALATNGLLTALTADSFAICCRAYQRLLEAESGPELKAAYSQWFRLAKQFRLIPADSSGKVVATEGSDLDEFRK